MSRWPHLRNRESDGHAELTLPPRSALAGRAPATSAMTLAVPALHALGGALQPGDRVPVLATFGAGSGHARSRPIARDLQVLDVGSAPGGADQTTATVPVTP